MTLSVLAMGAPANTGDGQTAVVPISNMAAGTVWRIVAGMQPVAAAALPRAATMGAWPAAGQPAQVTVALPHAGLWYLWAQEEIAGEWVTAAPAAPQAVWCGVTSGLPLYEIGAYLAAIISANAPGLDALVAPVYPNTRLQQVIFGYGGMRDAFPAIVITAPRKTAEFAFAGYGKRYGYSFTIGCSVIHEDESTELPLATMYAAGLQEILCYPHYETLVLPSGLQVVHCLATSGESSEAQLGENVFVSTATISWAGESLAQEPPEN